MSDPTEPTRVRVLLLSPEGRLFLMKYRNEGPSGISRPCWTTAGGGREGGETIEACARREVAEETGFHDVGLGPVVWYGEDSHRASAWNVTFREYFVVAFAPHEQTSSTNWTDLERRVVLETRWWSLDELRYTTETIYPFDLAKHLQPILEGRFPDEPVVLPPI